MVDVVTKAPENYPTEAHELAPDSPEKLAFGILEEYSENSGDKERKDLIEHAQRVLGYVKQYAGDIMPDCSSVVYLHDVVSRFLNKDGKYESESQNAAFLALAEYFTDPRISHDRARFERNVLADFEKCENEARKFRQDFAKNAAEKIGQTLLVTAAENGVKIDSDAWQALFEKNIVEMVSTRYKDNDIPKDVWLASMPELDPEGAAEFLKEVNIESVVIKACELLDNLRNPASSRESALLQDMLEAKSFYVPLCETLGLGALADNLASEVKKIRLRKTQGALGEQKIAEAKRELDEIREIGMERLLSDAFGDGSDEKRVATWSPVMRQNPYFDGDHENLAPDQVDVVEFVVGNGVVVSGNARIKNVGSRATKSDQEVYKDQKAMDSFGAMVISEDLQTSARDFAHIVANLRRRSESSQNHIQNPLDTEASQNSQPQFQSLELKKAPSKKRAIYVQGSQNYINTIKRALEQAGVPESEVQFKVQDETKDGYKKMEVSKVTFLMTYDCDGELVVVPTEIQFYDKAERLRSRLGEVAHIIYKTVDTVLKKEGKNYEDLPEAEREKIRQKRREYVKYLGEIYARKLRLTPDDFTVNGQSDEGGEKLFAMLAEFVERGGVTEPKELAEL